MNFVLSLPQKLDLKVSEKFLSKLFITCGKISDNSIKTINLK